MRSLRITIVLTALFSYSASPSWADAVFLIGSGDSSNTAMLQSILTSHGDQVTVGPTYNNFTGANLSGYREVLLAPSGISTGLGDMPVSGQQSLLGYVNSGGGLVTSGTVGGMTNALGDFQLLNAAVPVGLGPVPIDNSSITFSKLTNDIVVNANLPSTFTFQTSSASGGMTQASYIPKTGATAFFSESQMPPSLSGVATAYGVVGWNYGQGRVISFATTFNSMSLGDPNYAQLVDNAVRWSGRDSGQLPTGPNPPIEPGSFTPAPEPAALVSWGAGILGIAVVAYVRRNRAKS
jgi:hypothetical protein